MTRTTNTNDKITVELTHNITRIIILQGKNHTLDLQLEEWYIALFTNLITTTRYQEWQRTIKTSQQAQEWHKEYHSRYLSQAPHTPYKAQEIPLSIPLSRYQEWQRTSKSSQSPLQSIKGTKAISHLELLTHKTQRTAVATRRINSTKGNTTKQQ